MAGKPDVPYEIGYRVGIKSIANFLGVHPRTCQRLISDGKLPAEKDGLGRWIMFTLDYYTTIGNDRNLEIKAYAGVKWELLQPTVILVAEYHQKEDRIHLVRELYRKECYLEDFLAAAREWHREHRIRKFFCDPAEPEFIAKMRRAGLPAAAAPKEQDLARNLIKQRLANTKAGKPGGLTISRECVNTIPEFLKYHLPEGRSRPADADTHGIRALHFLVLGLSLEATPRVRWI